MQCSSQFPTANNVHQSVFIKSSHLFHSFKTSCQNGGTQAKCSPWAVAYFTFPAATFQDLSVYGPTSCGLRF